MIEGQKKKKKKKKKKNGQDDVKWAPLHVLMIYYKTLRTSGVYKLEPIWMQKKASEQIEVSSLVGNLELHYLLWLIMEKSQYHWCVI